jgi:hypothetical protein
MEQLRWKGARIVMSPTVSCQQCTLQLTAVPVPCPVWSLGTSCCPRRSQVPSGGFPRSSPESQGRHAQRPESQRWSPPPLGTSQVPCPSCRSPVQGRERKNEAADTRSVTSMCRGFSRPPESGRWVPGVSGTLWDIEQLLMPRVDFCR